MKTWSFPSFALLVYGFIAFSVVGCQANGAPLAQDCLFSKEAVRIATLKRQNRTGLYQLDGRPFTGCGERFGNTGRLQERSRFVDGRLEGLSVKWFAGGQLSQVAHYRRGRLHGEKKVWTLAGAHVLTSHLHYENGKPHGPQLKWYPTGELYKKLNLNMGREEGLQQGFRKNGALYANYEMVDGRLYGLKKASLCYGLDGEEIVKKGSETTP